MGASVKIREFFDGGIDGGIVRIKLDVGKSQIYWPNLNFGTSKDFRDPAIFSKKCQKLAKISKKCQNLFKKLLKFDIKYPKTTPKNQENGLYLAKKAIFEGIFLLNMGIWPILGYFKAN